MNFYKIYLFQTVTENTQFYSISALSNLKINEVIIKLFQRHLELDYLGSLANTWCNSKWRRLILIFVRSLFRAYPDFYRKSAFHLRKEVKILTQLLMIHFQIRIERKIILFHYTRFTVTEPSAPDIVSNPFPVFSVPSTVALAEII